MARKTGWTAVARGQRRKKLQQLWRAEKVLEAVGMPLEDWCPPADTPENSLKNRAFSKDGPTEAAIAIFEEAERASPNENYRALGVWNGYEGNGGAAMRRLHFLTVIATIHTAKK